MKIVKLIFSLIFIGILPISCFCPPPKEGPYKVSFSQIVVYKQDYLKLFQNGNYNAYLANNEVFAGDTLKMGLDYMFNFADSNPAGLDFTNSAYAFQCDDEPIFKELKDKVKNISITSDTIFNNLKPGDLLNDNVLIGPFRNGPFISINNYIEKFNTLDGNNFFREDNQLFYITEKPKSRQRHKFTITFTFESGKTETAETPRIIWQ